MSEYSPREQALDDAYRDQLLRAIRRGDTSAAHEAALALALGVQPALPGFDQPTSISGERESAVLDALGAATDGTPVARRLVREAYARCPDPGYLAKVLAQQGIEGLHQVGPRLYLPVRPALATRFRSPEEVWERLNGGEWLVEPKLDGWECQIHSGPQGVRLFTRSGRQPDRTWTGLAKAIKDLSLEKAFIIESEVIAVDPRSGNMLPRTKMQRPGTRHVAVAFDLLYLKGDWTRRRCDERFNALRELLINTKCDELVLTLQRRVGDLESFKRTFGQWASEGYEGCVCKRLEAPYEAGIRTSNRIKIKPVDTVDAVLVGYNTEAEAYLAAVRDSENGQFVPFAWLCSGLKAEDKADLAEATHAARLYDSSPKMIAGRLIDVPLSPIVVVEIKGDSIHPSPKYPCGRRQEGRGWTLSGAKFVRIRDKLPSQATTVLEFLRIRPMMGVDPPHLSNNLGGLGQKKK